MFGDIEGVKIGQLFMSRRELASGGVHAPLMSGIWGAQDGAYSIVLSGGYEDDIDELNYILYTGQGGQDVPGGKQVKDQEFTKGNRGLQLSCQYGLPVRVTRGHQIRNGPEIGYRYDGLYYVKSYDRIRGQRGFYICRFHLESDSDAGQLESTLSPHFKLTYRKVSRSEATVNKLKRNIRLSEKIKSIHNHRCQVCDIRLDSPVGPIAIGAHIRGLGRPHEGPDVLENMLCLCPNHHDQFDYFSYFIDPKTLEIKGLDGFEGNAIKVHPQHKIDPVFLSYHQEQYLKNK